MSSNEEIMWLVTSNTGIILFASKDIHSDSYKEKEAAYKSLFKVFDFYYCAPPIKVCSNGNLWVITDDNNSARFFIRGTAEDVKDEMSKYISRYGKPEGAFIGSGYIHHYYSFDKVTGQRLTARLILEL